MAKIVEHKNPIPKNYVGMPVSQLLECASLLRSTFDGILREDVDNENIIHNLTIYMNMFNRDWNKQ